MEAEIFTESLMDVVGRLESSNKRLDNQRSRFARVSFYALLLAVSIANSVR